MASIALVGRKPKQTTITPDLPTKIGARILTWMTRIGENSRAARAAESFARLNALSDADLAARGLKRGDLFWICYGSAASL